MLQEDFILRLIREFIQALGVLISRMKGKDDPDIEVQFNSFYKRYFDQKGDYFKEMPVEDMIKYINEKYPEQHRLPRVEMLSDLLYSEGSLISSSSIATKRKLWEKASYLYNYIDENDSTYSLPRMRKQEEIKKFIES
jgi:hypothetical protein